MMTDKLNVPSVTADTFSLVGHAYHALTSSLTAIAKNVIPLDVHLALTTST